MGGEGKRSGVSSSSSANVSIVEVADGYRARGDQVAVEEPLEIRVVAGAGSSRAAHAVAVTMRTPGSDFELAAGFLVSEGILHRRDELWRLARCGDADPDAAENIVEAHLEPGVEFDQMQFSRHVYTTSSCGICGVASIERLALDGATEPRGDFELSPEVLKRLPALLRRGQDLFARTGGIHAAGLFSPSGALEVLREDVGRHNAVDKVIGSCFLADRLPLDHAIMLVSGRASFELVQKALAGGIPMLAAVGAPSSLAVSTAREFGMTLVGFLDEERFNIYAGEDRLSVGSP